MEQKSGKRVETFSVMALFLVTILWGGGFVFSKFTLDAGLTPIAVMFGRFTLAALITGVFFHRQIRREYVKGQWKSGLVIGLILFFAFFSQTTALLYTTPGKNAFITAVNVVLVPLMWWALTKKRPPAIIFVASVLSLAGAGILSLNINEGLSIGFGDSLTLLCAALFAAQIVATGYLARTIHPTVLVFMQFTVAAVMSLIVFLITDRDFSGFVTTEGIIGLAYLGGLSTCLCYFLQTNAQRHLSSAKTGIIMATESLFGALFSVMLGYDQLTARMVVGGLVMFASILLPELWAARHPEKPNPETPAVPPAPPPVEE